MPRSTDTANVYVCMTLNRLFRNTAKWPCLFREKAVSRFSIVNRRLKNLCQASGSDYLCCPHRLISQPPPTPATCHLPTWQWALALILRAADEIRSAVNVHLHCQGVSDWYQAKGTFFPVHKVLACHSLLNHFECLSVKPPQCDSNGCAPSTAESCSVPDASAFCH